MVVILAEVASDEGGGSGPPVALPADPDPVLGSADKLCLVLHEGLVAGDIAMDFLYEFLGSEVAVVVLEHLDEGVEVVEEGLGLGDGEGAYVLLLYFLLLESLGHRSLLFID